VYRLFVLVFTFVAFWCCL